MSYLTIAELRASSGGLPLDFIPDDELQGILDDAKDLIDTVAPRHFDYREIGTDDPHYPAEIQLYDPRLNQVIMRERPVRKIFSITVQDAYFNGRRIGVVEDPADIELDASMGTAWMFSIRLTMVGGDLSRLLRGTYQPQLILSYSAGYDPGYVLDVNGVPTSTPSAPDGLVIPYPSWLKTATKKTAQMLAAEWLNNALHGMAGLQRAVAGPFTYEKEPVTPEGVPASALRLIRRNVTSVYVGGTAS